jgi:protein phosphatase
MRIEVAARTDTGHVRDQNEDSFVTGIRLWAVADGMGGQEAGEIASAIVANRLDQADANATLSPIELFELLLDINQEVVAYGREHREAFGLGSTVSGIALVNRDNQVGSDDDTAGSDLAKPEPDLLAVFNLGDSRVYRYRDHTLEPLTVDHNEAAALLAAGWITEQEAPFHPGQHILTRALGSLPTPLPDIATTEIRDADLFLICSDGLTSEILDPQIAKLLETGDLEEKAAELVSAALAHGGKDNVTVVLVQFFDEFQ